MCVLVGVGEKEALGGGWGEGHHMKEQISVILGLDNRRSGT